MDDTEKTQSPAQDAPHVRIEVVKDGRLYTITRRTTEPDNPVMLRRLLRGAAAEMDQAIAGVVELDDV